MFSLIVFFVGVASCVSQEELLVKTKSGSIQGHYNELNVREWNGKSWTYLACLFRVLLKFWVVVGIPYSEKPVGERRFEQSVAVKPWDDVYSADFMAPGKVLFYMFCIMLMMFVFSLSPNVQFAPWHLPWVWPVRGLLVSLCVVTHRALLWSKWLPSVFLDSRRIFRAGRGRLWPI